MSYFFKRFKPCVAPTLAILPLAFSVIPWGILCGTLSIEAGLTPFQAQLMSLMVFAGAAQLSGIAILGTQGSWLSLLNSTTMISARHVLYSATYKDHIAPLPFFKRLLFAFLLTDEMFVVAQAEQSKTGRFDYGYAVIAGAVFYLVWNIATLIGIFSAHFLKESDDLGFDFAIVATFIAMVVPMINTRAILIAVLVSAVTALTCALLGFEQGLLLSSLLGMTVGAVVATHQDTGKV